MKAFFTLIKIITIGIFWSVFFVDGVRVIMLENWRFDIVKQGHWQYAKDLWLSGWVISSAKEWAFVLIVLTSIPLWLTGWAALSMISFSKLSKVLLLLPAHFFDGLLSNKTRQVANKIATKTVVKKKSYKETRPIARDGGKPSSAQPQLKTPRAPTSTHPAPIPLTTAATKKTPSSSFNHALFDFDDEDDEFNFDIDAPVEKKPIKQEKPTKEKKTTEAPKNKKEAPAKDTPKQTSGTGSILEAIKQKGYQAISSVTIKNTLVDFIGISQEKIIIFLVDKEHGDWLADEEKFNGEEPLWFSENSHRISPVRKAGVVKKVLQERLDDTEFSQEVEAYVVNQMNNIINAEDMLEIWKDLKINVTRIDRGTPKDLPLLSKALDEAEEGVGEETAEKLRKIIRGIS